MLRALYLLWQPGAVAMVAVPGRGGGGVLKSVMSVSHKNISKVTGWRLGDSFS